MLTDIKGRDAAHVRIDEVDIERAAITRWHLDDGYARGQIRRRGKRVHISLHRLLLGAPRHRDVDHVNGDTLDCRRGNLRIVPRIGNAQNVVRPSKTGHRNVLYDEKRKRYLVRAGTPGKNRKWGGSFERLEDALEAAQKLRAELFEHVNEARHVAPACKS